MLWKRNLPLAVCFIMGVVFALRYYVPHRLSEELLTYASDWMMIIFGFSFMLAAISVIQSHWTKIRRQVPGWGFSIIVYLAIIAGAVAGIISEAEIYKTGTTTLTPHGWVYYNIMYPLQGTMFSLLAFFICSAAFRAFRARTLSAFLLLFAAITLLFGRVTLGEYLWDRVAGLITGILLGLLLLYAYTRVIKAGTFGSFLLLIFSLVLIYFWIQVAGIVRIWPEQVYNISFSSITKVVDWIMDYLNMPARRGILIGIALGMIAMSLKIIFGIERGYLGGGRE